MAQVFGLTTMASIKSTGVAEGMNGKSEELYLRIEIRKGEFLA